MTRKLLTFLKAVAIAALIVGCGETGREREPEVTPEIKFPEDIVTSGISVESASQSVTLSFTTNVAWSATVSADWITISPSSGEAGTNSVKVNVEENKTGGQPRSATMTVTDKGAMRKVSVAVRQEAFVATLNISPESLTFSADKGDEMLTVTSNTAWVITKDADWITLSQDKGEGIATIAAGVIENTSLMSRTGIITVSSLDGGASKTVSVQQAGADVVFTIDESEFNVAAAGESFTVKVTHNIGYKITSQPAWVKQTDKASGDNTDTYTFKAEANSSTDAREGTIVFCNDNDECVPVTVKQSGANVIFSVTPTLFDIDGNEQDITMTVTSNMDYSVNSMPEWISKKSENSGIHTFTVSANTASSARSGEIVFNNVNNSLLTVTVKQGIQTYTSSDYSQDGLVTKIHSATAGKGIDVVFVGDAFADKDQDLFNKYVEFGKEAFFTEEPFKSTKDRFNIYRIGSVSKNGIITQEGGDTKFSAEFTGGTGITGSHNDVFSFVQTNIPSIDLTKTIIFVIINKAQYAGTCWMYSNNQAICYIPLCRDENDYAQILRHEGCGHGFGKLADEYFYTSQGTIPETETASLKQWRSLAYGFYENVDLTSDPATILWSKFISDSRYSGKVGVYEGGYTYSYGVYRPTENSIMRYNTGGFNAPSREAIYKKIMRFSEGESWTYDYETFVAFDASARSSEAVTRASEQCSAVDKTNFIPLAPPVMVMVDE